MERWVNLSWFFGRSTSTWWAVGAMNCLLKPEPTFSTTVHQNVTVIGNYGWNCWSKRRGGFGLVSNAGRPKQRSVDHPRIRTFDDVYCSITECDNNASEVVAATIMMYNIVIVSSAKWQWIRVIPTTHCVDWSWSLNLPRCIWTTYVLISLCLVFF